MTSVAEVPPSRIIGMIGCRIEGGFEFDGLLATSSSWWWTIRVRGKGVGTHPDRIGRTMGAHKGRGHKMMVNTHHRRTQTHAFYRSRGFESTGLRFTKFL